MNVWKRRHSGTDNEKAFNDQFLICDIKMRMERPVERWFWFDPPFNRGRSALLHAQADEGSDVVFVLDALDPSALFRLESEARPLPRLLLQDREDSPVVDLHSLTRADLDGDGAFRHVRFLRTCPAAAESATR